jgi:hypothetical protein
VKKLLVLAALLVFLPTLIEAADVPGHFRKDGTYVAPHQRSNPDSNPYNNYSFPGNYNANTGQITPGDQNRYLERYQQQQRQNDLNRPKFDWNR